MKDINESLLESIELINESVIESETNVMNSMLEYYDKQSQIIEYCDDLETLNEFDIIQEFVFFQEADTEGAKDDSDTEDETKATSDAKTDDQTKDNDKKDKKKKKSNILKKIWNAIKKFFGMIVKHIKKIFNYFRNKQSKHDTGNAPVESVAAIADEVLKGSEARNKPDNINSWTFPKPDPKYVANKGASDDDDKKKDKNKDEKKKDKKEPEPEQKEETKQESFFDDFIYDDEYYMEDGDGDTAQVTIPTDPKSEIKGSTVTLKEQPMTVAYINNGKTLRFTILGFGKATWMHVKGNKGEKIQGQENEVYQSPKFALHVMTHDKDRDEMQEMVEEAIKVITDRKPEDIKKLKKHKLNILEANGLDKWFSPEMHTYEVPISHITATQTWASQLLEKMQQFTSIKKDISDLDKETIDCMNRIVKCLLRFQISLNFISTTLNADTSLLISKSQYKTIKSLDLLDEFVDKCVHSGVPPKYVAYNAWLIADECIRGNGKYKPMFGHARGTIFPPDERIVLKFGLCGNGVVSNETEEDLSDLYVNKMGRADLIAPVVKSFPKHAIVAMERIKGNFDLSTKELHNYADVVAAALEDYQKRTGAKLNFVITRNSQHIGNVAFDEKYKMYRSIDYGVHYRSANAEEKKKK